MSESDCSPCNIVVESKDRMSEGSMVVKELRSNEATTAEAEGVSGKRRWLSRMSSDLNGLCMREALTMGVVSALRSEEEVS